MQSPDVLLEHVIELSCKKQQHMSARAQWNSTLADAQAVAAASARQSTQLQHAASEARYRSKDGETGFLCKTLCKPQAHVWEELQDTCRLLYHLQYVMKDADLMCAGSQLHLHVIVLATFNCSLSAIFSQWLDASEDIPCLEAVVQSCQSATAFAEKEVKDAVTEWWTQPAVHAVPWVQCKQH